MWAVHTNNDTSKTLAPEFVFFTTSYKEKRSRLTCCDQGEPAYIPTHLAMRTDESDVYYMVGEAFTKTGSDWMMFKTNLGKIVFWILDEVNAP